jgi:hypothetical protein
MAEEIEVKTLQHMQPLSAGAKKKKAAGERRDTTAGVKK